MGAAPSAGRGPRHVRGQRPAAQRSAAMQRRQFDEVWVPSEFNRQTFVEAGVRASKVRVVPEAIDLGAWDPSKVKPASAGEGEEGGEVRPYRFLSVFKMEDRKNWKMLVEAFMREFDAAEPVRLVIKTRPCGWCGYSHPGQAVRRFAEELEGRREGAVEGAAARVGSQLLVQEEEVNMEQLRSIYAAADAFVLPSHGEGWGLTLMESMAMALPTVGTGWSGNLAFMDEAHSILLDVDRMEQGFEHLDWAVPSIATLRGAMRGLMLQPEAGRELGQRARAHIAEHFGREPVSAIVKARLLDIAHWQPSAGATEEGEGETENLKPWAIADDFA